MQLPEDDKHTYTREYLETMLAVQKFQRKVGMEPADGYPGIKLLARLRQGL